LNVQLNPSGALVDIHCEDNTVKRSLVRCESPNYPDGKWERVAKNRTSSEGSMELRANWNSNMVPEVDQFASAEVPPSAMQEVFL
jgi:hypothetical protein